MCVCVCVTQPKTTYYNNILFEQFIYNLPTRIENFLSNLQLNGNYVGFSFTPKVNF